MTREFYIRQAVAQDVPAIFGLIQALAEYEQLAHQVTGTEEDLKTHLFGVSHVEGKPNRIFAEAIVVEVEAKIVGFALFFPNYSTFLTKPAFTLKTYLST